jgi:Holliday junction resolvasome RuvABC endonuclease subunit
MNQTNKFRILSLAPTTRGVGYAVIEGENMLVAYGVKTARVKRRDKNARLMAHVKTMFLRYRPDKLVLYDLNAKGVHRRPRIKELQRFIVRLAQRRKLNISKFSRIEVQSLLLGGRKGTKHAVAQLLAERFPAELASRLPPKRIWYDPEDRRIDIFEAVALVVAFRLKNVKRTD